ncbi:MAG TPA: SRPBCC family protein [Gammaproteobacteria bacterium]|nr:SRPBCC family protein [Gammaproteobacteria bacterium]
MAEFQFVTVWRIEAPLTKVCDAVSQCIHWPRWWKGVVSVQELELGDAQGVGSLRRFTWKGRLPYRLTFDLRVTRVVPLTILEAHATGEVEGTGRWQFSKEGAVTVVRYDWRVRTNRFWMNLVAPVARPVFKWNHDQVMRQGAEGMARLLDTHLLSLVHS